LAADYKGEANIKASFSLGHFVLPSLDPIVVRRGVYNFDILMSGIIKKKAW
jgi:hypothetical protein